MPILLISGAVFLAVDKEPTIRQLYPIAELGKPKNAPTRTPKFNLLHGGKKFMVLPLDHSVTLEALSSTVQKIYCS
jgi:hypothetical protein